MQSWSDTSRRIVPLPVPLFTVTVKVVPLPLIPVIEAPETPVVVSANSPATTSNTGSLKVTVKSTLLALVGFGSARVIERTLGANLYVTSAIAQSALAMIVAVAAWGPVVGRMGEDTSEIQSQSNILCRLLF